MANASTLDVTVNYDEVDRLRRSGAVRAELEAASGPIVQDARGRAPKATGRGARSIHGQTVLDRDEWAEFISWDQFHYYMYFSERGTRERPPHAFLVPALKDAQR